jgi:CRP/FNR family transcriptional regulator, cyclic AMP receptor protein
MVSPELIRRYPFFGGLTESQLAGIAMIADEVGFTKGQMIGGQSTPASKFYLLTEGSVDLLYSSGEQGRITNAPIGEVAPGEAFALSALLEPYCLTTSLRAAEDVCAVAVDAAGLRAMCEVDARLGYILMRNLSRTAMERLDGVRVQLAAAETL